MIRSEPPESRKLALMLKQLGEKVDPNRELTAVYVYRGKPGPKSGPKAQAGSARQFGLVGISTAREGQKQPSALPTDGMVNGPADSVAG